MRCSHLRGTRAETNMACTEAKTSSGGACAKARTLAEARHVGTKALGGYGVEAARV
ncbi:hypothetical protein ES288_D08G174000v1 [Gossypium darwinii]|uniref:Uncharacterized protein n=1 Tax=Gossypium darwinii TaxID=34276 RepID=A0A5D2BMP3_GOSDA|nr:hypothetical protein ES288_D08G174000v1 [Gossypium darwinii]